METKALTTGDQTQTIRALLEKSKTQIQLALPRHMNADKMLRIAMTAVQKTPKLAACHPVTLLGAVIQSAQLGLEPNDGTGQAYLVPFHNSKKNRDEVQFIAGYRGLMRLARNSGDIKRFDAHVVREGDHFKYAFGLRPELEHTPSGKAGALTHVYAVAEFKDGGVQFEVMTKEEVEAIRKRSKAASSGPWVTDYEEMAKKTVVRRLCKMLPLSTEMQKAVTLDERAEVGLPQDLGTLVDETEKGTDEAPEPVAPPKRKSEVIEAQVEKTEPAAAPAEEGLGPVSDPVTAPAQESEANDAECVTIVASALSMKEGKGAKGPWTKWSVKDQDGDWYSTFNHDHGAILSQAKAESKRVTLTYEVKGEYKNITDAKLA